jgi:hypothetical protein
MVFLLTVAQNLMELADALDPADEVLPGLEEALWLAADAGGSR